MSILVLTSDTLIGTAAAGNIEYSSPIFAATPIGTQRGIVPTQQYYRLDSAYVGSNATGAQSMFGVGVTLSASTVYAFDIEVVFIRTAGTTAHTLSTLFGGTATINNIYYGVFQVDAGGVGMNSRGTSIGATPINVVTATVVTASLSTASQMVMLTIKGTVSINAGGTFIPQYQLSAAPGGAYTTQIGSYIRINPLSASGANTSVGTWA